MAVIGCLGDVLFSVSRGTVKTLDGMKWDSGARFSVHERHGKEPLLEFTGLAVETVSFNITLSAFLGVDPMKELGALLTAERKGWAMRLVLGTHAYGTNKWVIEKISSTLEHFDKSGELLHARTALTLKAYSAR